MSLLVYKISDYEHTAEREQYRNICKILKERFSKENGLYLFIANYNLYDCKLDGLLIKPDAIISVEFKSYRGKVTTTENGKWTLQDNTIVKGGSKKGLYKQAKLNHIAIKNAFKDGSILPNNQIEHIYSLIVFHQEITCINNLSTKTKSSLYIADESNFIEKVENITSSSTDLSNDDILSLTEGLGLNELFLDEQYSNKEILHGLVKLELEFAREEPKNVAISEFPIKKKESTKIKPKVKEGTPFVQAAPSEEKKNIIVSSDLPKSTYNDSEKNSLKNLVGKIIQTVFKSSNANFEIYACEKENIPSFLLEQLTVGYQYLVALVSPDTNNEKVYAKLKKFLHKDIELISEKYICWFEGEEINSQYYSMDEPKIFSDKSDNVFFLKNYTSLPAWLDSYLYNDLEATYAPEYSRYEYNLDLTEIEAKVYLGTYAPRSYAESFCIFDNLFQNKEYLHSVPKDQISILDVGCGTGGDLIGLIIAIEKYISSDCLITIYAVDGNKFSLDILTTIIEIYKKRTKKFIDLHCINTIIIGESSLTSLAEILNQHKFDFILSFKMVSELISKQLLGNKNAYFETANYFLPLLSFTGLFVILDVTTKDPNSGIFYPIIMNDGLNKINDSQYKTLLPISCNFYGSHCNISCFYQHIFKVSHKKKTDDVSKVAYRILGCSSFVQRLEIMNGKSVINHQRYDSEDISAYCTMSLDHLNPIDAFNFKFK